MLSKIIFEYLSLFTQASQAAFPFISLITSPEIVVPDSFNFDALCIAALKFLTHGLGTPISPLFITIPVIACLLFFLKNLVFAAFTLKPSSFIILEIIPSTFPILIPSSLEFNTLFPSLKLKLISSAYLEYVNPYLDASPFYLLSYLKHIIFVIIGLAGDP